MLISQQTKVYCTTITIDNNHPSNKFQIEFVLWIQEREEEEDKSYTTEEEKKAQ